jgi:hypothetical protein
MPEPRTLAGQTGSTERRSARRQIGARDGALLVSSHVTWARLDAGTRTVDRVGWCEPLERSAQNVSILSSVNEVPAELAKVPGGQGAHDRETTAHGNGAIPDGIAPGEHAAVPIDERA